MANNKKIALYSVLGSCCIILLLAGLLTVIMAQGASSTSTVMQPAAGIEVDGAIVDTSCTGFSSWVGQAVDEATVKATGRVYRILTPTSPATMDYLEGRINVLVDDQGVVLQVTCG